MNSERRRPNKVVIIIILVSIVIIATAVLITNAIYSQWTAIELMVGVGITLTIIGAVLIYTSFAGGTQVSSTRMHAMAPEMAHAEKDYAFKKRHAIPIISFIIFFTGVILLIIFMPRIWV